MLMRFVALLVLLLYAQIAAAFRLSPMVVEFDPGGKGATQVFTVENNGRNKIALVFEMTTRAHDASGKENREATKDFLIYPEQFALEANDRRNVRVTYVGDANLGIERSYRFIATQLPVGFGQEAKGSSLKFLLQYVGAVYVTPNGSHPEVYLESARLAGEDEVAFLLGNRGTAHKNLSDVHLELNARGDGNPQPLRITEKARESLTSENLLPGDRREIRLKLQDKVSDVDKRVEASIEFPTPSP